MSRQFLAIAAAALSAFALDAGTKAWAEAALLRHHPVPVAGDVFRFTLGYNPGVAFGMLAGGGVWVAVLSGSVVLGLLAWLDRAVRAGRISMLASPFMGLLLGGAVANLADRIPDARVTDFLDVGLGAARWPTFNLADAFILVGSFALLWALERDSERSETSAP